MRKTPCPAKQTESLQTNTALREMKKTILILSPREFFSKKKGNPKTKKETVKINCLF
jgi:hypothetical protein